jgi:hypothetical protein
MMKCRCTFAAVLLLPILLGTAPPATTQNLIAEKCNAVLAGWKTRFDEEHFNYVISAPFVIAGDGTPAAIIRYRDGTILPSARALTRLYFQTAPSEPILILLFESDGSYRRLADKWFDDRDVPHFGFYRPAQHVMLMNVATGTGTLVHEMTHALMAPDFPSVPDWFNEGLASLYEQSTIGPDTIRGLPNWRLPALQSEIARNQLRSTEAMIGDPDFRSPERVGMNYAHARYVMLYLQDRGLLQKYYRNFRDHCADDPTGLQTLKDLLSPQTLEQFDQQWRPWVMELQR